AWIALGIGLACFFTAVSVTLLCFFYRWKPKRDIAKGFSNPVYGENMVKSQEE
ncbi:Hypothetical predicted protein, partial [Pelobates cultripes]